MTPQQELLLDYLKEGRTLTNVIAATNLGVQSVSRRITELQDLGYEIEKTWKQDHFGKRYVTYSLKMDEQESPTPETETSE